MTNNLINLKNWYIEHLTKGADIFLHLLFFYFNLVIIIMVIAIFAFGYFEGK